MRELDSLQAFLDHVSAPGYSPRADASPRPVLEEHKVPAPDQTEPGEDPEPDQKKPGCACM